MFERKERSAHAVPKKRRRIRVDSEHTRSNPLLAMSSGLVQNIDGADAGTVLALMTPIRAREQPRTDAHENEFVVDLGWAMTSPTLVHSPSFAATLIIHTQRASGSRPL